MLFSTTLRFVEKSTGLSAPLCKTRASPRLPWRDLSRILRRRRLIMGHYQTHPLPHPALGLTLRGSTLHNQGSCKLTPTPSPTPSRSRVTDRPAPSWCHHTFRFIKVFPGASLPAAPPLCLRLRSRAPIFEARMLCRDYTRPMSAINGNNCH